MKKVIRILIYEGTDRFLSNSLGQQRTVKGIFRVKGGKITEYVCHEEFLGEVKSLEKALK